MRSISNVRCPGAAKRTTAVAAPVVLLVVWLLLPDCRRRERWAICQRSRVRPDAQALRVARARAMAAAPGAGFEPPTSCSQTKAALVLLPGQTAECPGGAHQQEHHKDRRVRLDSVGFATFLLPRGTPGEPCELHGCPRGSSAGGTARRRPLRSPCVAGPYPLRPQIASVLPMVASRNDSSLTP